MGRTIAVIALVSGFCFVGCGSNDEPIAPDENPNARLRDSCGEEWLACPPAESIWTYTCDGFPVIGNMLRSEYEFVVDSVGDSLGTGESVLMVIDYRLSTRCVPAPEPECAVAVTTCTTMEIDGCIAGRYFWFELVDEQLRFWQVGLWSDTQ